MSLEFIIPDSLATNEEYIVLLKLFFSDNLEKFFEDYAINHMQDDEAMLDVYFLSDYLNDFIHIFFTSIIQGSLEREEYPAHLGEIMELWDDCYIRIKKNCARLINKLPLDNKEQAAKKIEEILQTVIKIDKQTEQQKMMPGYIIKLVDNGYIETDGITAIASLDSIAEFLYMHDLKNFNFKTLLQFRQHNGLPFSENTAKEAVKRAKI